MMRLAYCGLYATAVTRLVAAQMNLALYAECALSCGAIKKHFHKYCHNYGPSQPIAVIDAACLRMPIKKPILANSCHENFAQLVAVRHERFQGLHFTT